MRKDTKGNMKQRTGFKARQVRAGGAKEVARPCLPENSISVVATNGANQTFQALVSVVRGRRGVYVCNGPKGMLETPRRVGLSTVRIRPESLLVSTADYQRIVALRGKDNPNAKKKEFRPMMSTTPGPRRA